MSSVDHELADVIVMSAEELISRPFLNHWNDSGWLPLDAAHIAAANEPTADRGGNENDLIFGGSVKVSN